MFMRAPAASCGATCPIEPAPIVSTTSPSRATVAHRLGDVADLVDEQRLDVAADADRARQRTAVGGDDRRLAGRVDVGQHERVDGRQHAREILEQVARARVAVRLEREHEAPAREAAARRVEHRGDLGRMVAVVVDQRRSGRRRRARPRRSAGSAGRRP